MAIPLSYNLRNLRVRKTTTLMTALGIALTVAVLLGIMAMVAGLRSALQSTGNPLQLIVVRKNSPSELSSQIAREAVLAIRFKEGIQKTPEGRADGFAGDRHGDEPAAQEQSRGGKRYHPRAFRTGRSDAARNQGRRRTLV